ncbi:MAG: hypothetical protein HYV68_03615 [Candidatus Taylorbacteria bacterium]|nr:hypothetical protein [Candidatus Taylorbacteria bacterium]
MVNPFSRKGRYGSLSTVVMAMVIMSAPFMIPATESIDEEGEDIENLTEAINLLGTEHTPVSYKVGSSTPQFVLFSFDGSKSLSMLEETLQFADEMDKAGKPLRFTYYINAAYFLTEQNAAIYKPPHREAGSSNIGYSNKSEDIAERVKAFNRALKKGHEIGSHAVGHFNGQHWSDRKWREEFNSFKSLLYNVQANNNTVKIDQAEFLQEISGFRAPDLGVNEELYGTLKDFGFRYDTSGIGSMEEWPKKDILGIWHVPIGVMFMGPRRVPVLSMDYSIWIVHGGGRDNAVRGSELWDKYFKETKDAFVDYFHSNYNGSRAPVVIANHFTKMNDGVYWDAMKAAAEEVCGLPNVRCTTFKTFIDYLDKYGVPERSE